MGFEFGTPSSELDDKAAVDRLGQIKPVVVVTAFDEPIRGRLPHPEPDFSSERNFSKQL
jgi:hypothetical protein